MHFLLEAKKHPEDIDAKLSQDWALTYKIFKNYELKDFA